MNCPNCNKKIDNDSKFCQFCGKDSTVKKKYTFIVDDKKDKKGSVDDYFNNKESADTSLKNKGEIITGIIAVVVGVAITWITYEMASDGGTYFVFWGLIIYGGYKIFKGLLS